MNEGKRMAIGDLLTAISALIFYAFFISMVSMFFFFVAVHGYQPDHQPTVPAVLLFFTIIVISLTPIRAYKKWEKAMAHFRSQR